MKLPKAPRNIRLLRKDARGFPVPWFVHWQGKEPDFRCVARGKVEEAIKGRLCWICGRPLDELLTFVTGPLCAVNGTAAEPPSHRDCGAYSARACPFLTKPRMRRNDKDLAVDATHPSGAMIDRNPGVTLLWTTSTCRIVEANGGVLFRVGPPVEIAWMAQGRAAARDEVLAALDGGMDHLRQLAAEESSEAEAALARLYDLALTLIPAAA